MDIIEFKKIVREITSRHGFVYHNKNFYYEMSDFFIVIGLQKSNYDNSYYINFGFFLKEMHKDIQYPKSNECDIVCRFLNGKGNDAYQIELQKHEEIVISLEKNINEFIVPVINEGIKQFFVLFPNYSCLASLNLKKYLGIV